MVKEVGSIKERVQVYNSRGEFAMLYQGSGLGPQPPPSESSAVDVG